VDDRTTVPKAQATTVFNVTVHMAGGTADDDEFAERLTRILVEQAQRHGLDLR
jgi:hypothetical protein